MKNIKGFNVIARLQIFLCFTLLVSCTLTPEKGSEHAVSTKQVVGTIQATLLEVNTRLGEKNAPRIKQAKLILNTTLSKSQQGKMSLLPVSGNTGASQSATGTLTINLKPVPEKINSDKTYRYDAHVEIAEAIVTSVKEIMQVEQGPVPMKFEQVVARLSFNISSNAAGSISLQVASISVGSEFSQSQNDSHTLELVFVPR